MISRFPGRHNRALKAIGNISRRLGFGAADYRIFRAGATLATFGAVAKLSGVARDTVVAATFGMGDALDAYVVALTIPTLIVSIFISAFGATLIPTYIELRKDNARAALNLTANIWMLVCVAAVLGIVIVALAAHPLVRIVGAGFLPPKSALTVSLLYLLLPMVFLQGVANFWGNLLNANGRFALAASTPIITSVIATFAVLRFGGTWGIAVLALATLGGVALEATIIATKARQTLGSLMPRWHGYDRDTRAAMAQYFPVLAGSFVTSIIVLVDQTVAARLGPGSIAAINYGNKLVTVILTLIAVAIGTAVLPYFSRFVAVRDWHGARACLHRWIAIMFFSSLAIMAVFLIYADAITALIFQRGAFTAAETAIVANISRCYSLQFPFFFCNILCVRMMIALRLNKSLLWVAIVDLLINASLDVLLAHFMGPAGIAVACSTVYAFSFACVWILVERRLASEIRRETNTEPVGAVL